MLNPRSGRNDTRNEIFIFFVFFGLSLHGLAEWSQNDIFLIFWIFVGMLLLGSGRNGTRNEFFLFLFFPFFGLFWRVLARNEVKMI